MSSKDALVLLLLRSIYAKAALATGSAYVSAAVLPLQSIAGICIGLLLFYLASLLIERINSGGDEPGETTVRPISPYRFCYVVDQSINWIGGCER